MSSSRPFRPGFYVHKLDQRNEPIDEGLLDAAEQIWVRFERMVRDALPDGLRAGALLDQVVQRIADLQHEKRLPPVLDAPKPLLLTRCRWELLNEIRRERRIRYVGTLSDLDSLYGKRESGTGSEEDIHKRTLIAEALALLKQDTRRLVMMRLMDLDWAEIGDELGERPGTLKERFRVALQRLREQLSSGSSEDEEGMQP